MRTLCSDISPLPGSGRVFAKRLQMVLIKRLPKLCLKECPANRAGCDRVARLENSMEDKNADHRKKALQAIGGIAEEPRAVKLAAKGLQDKDAEVRQMAAAALGGMKCKDAIPHLKAALDDSPEVSSRLQRHSSNLVMRAAARLFKKYWRASERSHG